MINLKLAEYNAEGKFERFLLLSGATDFYIVRDGFLLGDNFIEITENRLNYRAIFKKDKTDPLNRFNGRFNNRSYGNGRFVLIESKIISRFDNPLLMSQDDIFSYNEYIQKACDFINFHHWEETEDQVEINPNFKILGNLHENPELWGKIK